MPSNAATRFQVGASGNPGGRPRKLLLTNISATLRKSARAHLAGRADEIIQLAVENAAAGDAGCVAAVVSLMAVAVNEPNDNRAMRRLRICSDGSVRLVIAMA